MENRVTYRSVYSPPVKWNCFTGGGGIFGFAKIQIDKEQENQQTGQGSSAATAPTNDSYWDESVSRVDTNWTGSGTETDPWLITSAAELAGLSYTIYNNTKSSYLTSSYYYYSGCYFKQTVNIDVSAYWWQPIGLMVNRSGSYDSRYFSGNYDGDGHTVSGIFTQAGKYETQGLFGYVCANSSVVASIKNLGIINSNIQATYEAGGIAGVVSGTLISNCYNSGNISSTRVYCGGIVGQADSNSIITNCYNIGEISGSNSVGGIIGQGYHINISNCYNIGNITSINTASTGGILGADNNNTCTITNSYYGGNCTLTKGVGSGTDTATKDSNLISNAKTLSWYQDSSKWNGSYPWDFDKVWEFRSGENNGYPVLKVHVETWNDFAANSFASGSGTAASPYIIKTAAQLAKVAVDSRSSTLSGKYYKLGSDIDLSAHIWEGIGDDSLAFSGNFDGNLYMIKNIKTSVDNYAPANAGLFSVAKKALIQNVFMSGGTISSKSDAGGIVGKAGEYEVASQNAIIKNCIVDGVTIQEFNANLGPSNGGITGAYGEISSCLVKNTNITSKTGCVGGLSGFINSNSQAKDCAVINCNLVGSNLSSAISRSGTLSSTYAKCSLNGEDKKVMYGDSSAWGNWTYSPALNNGYPVQKTLFHIGGLSGSENVYNYLLNKLNLILDMDKYMAWTNEQLAAHSRTQYNMTKDAEGVYAWSGDSGGYNDNGFNKFFYNPGTLVTGATYKLSYTAKNTRTDSEGTTCIWLGGGVEYIQNTVDYVNTQEWTDYWSTFRVTDASTFNFNIGYSYGDLTYFKDIRLERLS